MVVVAGALGVLDVLGRLLVVVDGGGGLGGGSFVSLCLVSFFLFVFGFLAEYESGGGGRRFRAGADRCGGFLPTNRARRGRMPEPPQ